MNDSGSLDKEISTQLAISGVSEVVGMSVAIGSVLLARRVMPGQISQLERMFSRLLSRWGGGSPEAGIKATDFLLMNMGGAANMASQFALHRIKTPENEKMPLPREALRVITGRFAGTLGAASAVALAEYHAGGSLRRAEQAITHTTHAAHLSPLIVSSLLQSAGALGPNVAAQVLFDHLTRRNPSEEGKSQ